MIRYKCFHDSFSFFIKFINFFGLLPVTGLSSIHRIRFGWTSWKTIYTILIAFIYLVNTLFLVIHWTTVKFSFKIIIKQLNQINALTTLILYCRLAKKWPKFVKLWDEVDQKMSKVYRYPSDLDFRIKLGSGLAVALSMTEYILLLVYHIRKNELDNNGEFIVENYYLEAFPELFSMLPFNWLTACFATITSIVGYLIWTINDLFIVLISSALALRFKQITRRLYLDETKSNSHNYWIDIRADYDRLIHLSRKLEKYVSNIVLLSYSANIFFLLIQLSNVIGHLNYSVQILYFVYSFSFLIVRLVCVSLYGSWIIDESKEPSNVLHAVPSQTYGQEIRRFLYQVSYNDIGITGNNMFKVTRGLLLNIAGAIVTYELVMIQFNDSAGL